MKPGAKPPSSRRDRLPIIFAGLGFLLMCGTILFRINPVEGSVVPDFFHQNIVGIALYWIMFVTCMPVFLLTAALVRDEPFAWLPAWVPVFNSTLLVIQVVVYWLLGKIASMLRTKWSRSVRPEKT